MAAGFQKERRRQKARGFNFERSVFLGIPAKVAVPSLGLAVSLTALADYLAPQYVWFGPVYLLVIAFAAWSVNCRVAIALGLLVICANFATGNATTYPYGPNSVALNFALRYSAVLAVVLMLGLARRSLEKEWRLARTDPLTGALNRQAFFEAIKTETDCGEWAVLVYADLDGLKQLNDKIGHERGDNSLRDFASRARNAIRKSDVFARIGGDEFVIFMKVRDEAAGKSVANRLNKVLNLDASEDETVLKCSLGILLLPRGLKSIDAALKSADKLMYVAKRARAGFSLALAVERGGQITLSPPLEAASLPARKTVVRSEKRPPDNAMNAPRSAAVEALTV